MLSPTTATATANSAPGVRGPDVASHQHPYGADITWSGVAAGGAQFAFVKASEGPGYTNPYFASDFEKVRTAGLVRGAYHFARPSTTAGAIDQARHFVAVAGTLNGSGDLPPVLDLELTDGLRPPALIAWTQAYLNEVRRLTGRVPMIYTYPGFWRSAMANTTAFRDYPLWIATWGAQPTLVGGWTSYTFWQYTDQASLPGIVAAVDMSIFNGSRADLLALAGGEPVAGKPSELQATATLSTNETRVGSSVTMTGATSSRLAGETVYRQGYWSGSWHTWATTRISSSGRYSFTIHPTRQAVNTYRVYIRSTSKHPAVASRTLTLTVR